MTPTKRCVSWQSPSAVNASYVICNESICVLQDTELTSNAKPVRNNLITQMPTVVIFAAIFTKAGMNSVSSSRSHIRVLVLEGFQTGALQITSRVYFPQTQEAMSMAFTEICHSRPGWSSHSKINNMFLNHEGAGGWRHMFPALLWNQLLSPLGLADVSLVFVSIARVNRVLLQ